VLEKAEWIYHLNSYSGGVLGKGSITCYIKEEGGVSGPLLSRGGTASRARGDQGSHVTQSSDETLKGRKKNEAW